MAHRYGNGSVRSRRPGVWEIRVAVGTDPLTGRTVQRSVTFRGTECEARQHCTELAAAARARRQIMDPSPMLSVASLLERWLEADQPWKPSTFVSYRSNAAFLSCDPLGAMRVVSLSPRLVRAALARWETAGATRSVLAGRFRVLRAAMGWAYREQIIDRHPIRDMRGPSRPEPRRPVHSNDLVGLLRSAEQLLIETLANDIGTKRAQHRRHMAEQDPALAPTGRRLRRSKRRAGCPPLRRPRRAGPAHRPGHVRWCDHHTPKSGRARHLTLGASTAQLWHRLHCDWEQRAGAPLGRWVFSARQDHHHPMAATALGHRFSALAAAAGTPEATLHRLRHNVATFLVARGEILQAQARLGHADPATTLREYAYALPLQDQDVADAIDQHLAWAGRRTGPLDIARNGPTSQTN